jgi:hypothetical protein
MVPRRRRPNDPSPWAALRYVPLAVLFALSHAYPTPAAGVFTFGAVVFLTLGGFRSNERAEERWTLTCFAGYVGWVVAAQLLARGLVSFALAAFAIGLIARGSARTHSRVPYGIIGLLSALILVRQVVSLVGSCSGVRGCEMAYVGEAGIAVGLLIGTVFCAKEAWDALS